MTVVHAVPLIDKFGVVTSTNEQKKPNQKQNRKKKPTTKKTKTKTPTIQTNKGAKNSHLFWKIVSCNLTSS